MGGGGVWIKLSLSFLPSLLPSVRKLIWRQRGKFSERCGDDDDDVALRFLALCDGQLVNQEGEEDDGKKGVRLRWSERASTRGRGSKFSFCEIHNPYPVHPVVCPHSSIPSLPFFGFLKGGSVGRSVGAEYVGARVAIAESIEGKSVNRSPVWKLGPPSSLS